MGVCSHILCDASPSLLGSIYPRHIVYSSPLQKNLHLPLFLPQARLIPIRCPPPLSLLPPKTHPLPETLLRICLCPDSWKFLFPGLLILALHPAPHYPAPSPALLKRRRKIHSLGRRTMHDRNHSPSSAHPILTIVEGSCQLYRLHPVSTIQGSSDLLPSVSLMLRAWMTV